MQHVYRRGHVFWWRRVHRISGGGPVDVRISLKTFDRLEASSRGAALSAITGGVTGMLNERILKAGHPTERELQAIAKAMYEEKLAALCTDQRSTPTLAEQHRFANRAYADYFQRLATFGGGFSLMSPELARLEAAGWEKDRIDGLREAVRLREEKGLTGIDPADVDRHLLCAGFTPSDELRWVLQLALYRPFRDAFLEANAQLERDTAPAPLAAHTAVAP